MPVDDFLPVYDVSDGVAVLVDADPDSSWQALLEVDLLGLGREAPLVGALGAIRAAPELLGQLARGRRPRKPPSPMRLRDFGAIELGDGGWVVLEEEPRRLTLGLVGKFWRPVIEFADVDADRFKEFSEPGFAKTIYELSAAPSPAGGTLLSGLMRTATTDEHARRWFRRYWTLGVGSGAHLLVFALLGAAASKAGPDPVGPPAASLERG